MGVIVNPASSSPPAVINLAHHRLAVRRAAAAQALAIPSPPGFAFLGLPEADALPAFMKPGLVEPGLAESEGRDV